MKRLVRPTEGRWIAGVSQAFANYFELDVTLIRLIWIALIILPPSALLAYVICWILIPNEPVAFAAPAVPHTHQQIG